MSPTFRCKLCGQEHPLFWELQTSGDRRLAYEHLEPKETFIRNHRTGNLRIRKTISVQRLYLPKRMDLVPKGVVETRPSKALVRLENRHSQLEFSQIGLQL